MCRVEENTAALYRRFCSQGIECLFELNPGSHFQEVEQRLAKGVAWAVSDTAEEDHLAPVPRAR